MAGPRVKSWTGTAAAAAVAAAASLAAGLAAAGAGAPAEAPDPAATAFAKSGTAGPAAVPKKKPPKKKDAAPPGPAAALPAIVESAGDVALAPLDPGDFASLPLEQKLLAYHLSEAAWAGDRILLDQNYRFNVAIRDLVAEIVSRPKALPKPLWRKFRDYLVLLYVHHGVHDVWSGKKLLPAFTSAELAKAAAAARASGAYLCDSDDDCLPSLLAALRDPIFSAEVDGFRTVKDPPAGKDILTASAVNFYEGVSLADLASFVERYPLDSKIVLRDGKPLELPYRMGGEGVAPGLYARELAAVSSHLGAALPFAAPAQRAALAHLLSYYRTGDPAAFERYEIAWVKDAPAVETINGFIETYKDPRGAKGSWEGIVAFVDAPGTRVMRALADHAADFEARMPWLDAYKKKDFAPPVASAFTVLVETGDGGPMSWTGINLPNAAAIREKHGHKNFLLTNVMAARRAATGLRAIDEFTWDAAEAAEAKRCFEPAGTALVALHEVTGHGSGRVSPALKGDPAAVLKEYYSTLEEARADLVALWLARDPLALSLGVLPDERCADALLSAYVRGFPLRLRSVPAGDVIEEDHLRAESMIVHWLVEKGAAAEVHKATKIITDMGDRVDEDPRVFLRVLDRDKARAAVGALLAELMRIKAEGDYVAIKALVGRLGTKVELGWREDATARALKLDLPVRVAVLPATLVPVMKAGAIADVVARPARTEADVTALALRAGAEPAP